MQYEKVYVEILARFLRGGGMRPTFVVWEDGKRYAVDRVRFVERAPAHVGSVLPMRYTCIVAGRERRLYFETEEMRWFVEIER